MRRFLVKALQNAGYVVTSFDNGLSAYNRLREEPFELLLTDIVMPEMDGIESPAARPNSTPKSRSCSSRASPRWRSTRTMRRLKMPASSPSPFIFETWLTKLSDCSRLERRLRPRIR